MLGITWSSSSENEIQTHSTPIISIILGIIIIIIIIESIFHSFDKKTETFQSSYCIFTMYYYVIDYFSTFFLHNFTKITPFAKSYYAANTEAYFLVIKLQKVSIRLSFVTKFSKPVLYKFLFIRFQCCFM